MRESTGLEAVPGLILLNANASDLLPLRRWPIERYAVVGKRLTEADPAIRILITGSPEEVPAAEALAGMIGKAAIGGAGKIAGLKRLAAVMRRCALYIGCSTGPTHLAAAMGTPTVVICGPESLERRHPLGDRNYLVKKDVPCRPCASAGKISVIIPRATVWS